MTILQDSGSKQQIKKKQLYTNDNIKGIGLERLSDNFNIHVLNCSSDISQIEKCT